MAVADHPVELPFEQKFWFRDPSGRSHPSYWGCWFVPLGDGNVKQTNLNIFYYLGAALEDVGHVATGMQWFDAWMKVTPAQQWLLRFLAEILSVPLPDSQTAANELLDALNAVESRDHIDHPLTQEEVVRIHQLKEKFEAAFDRERQNIDVFTVTPKGIYNTRLLIENTEDKFPASVRKVLPPEMFYDLRQAGRCLAFEVPTACAFHIFRATEVVILRYHEVLAGGRWSKTNRNWAAYIEELNSLRNVNKDVTMRLDEIRKFERNPSIHPEAVVSLERAPTLFELCTGVIHTMGDEISKLTT